MPDATIDRDLPELNGITKPILLIGPAGSGKSDRLRDRALPQPIDLASMTEADKAVEETRCLAPANPIAIDHFEHRIDDALFNEQKLRLLENLVFIKNRPIVLVSSVDPLYYFGASGDASHTGDSLARWASLLSRFDRCDIRPWQPRFLKDPELQPGLLTQAETYYRAVWSHCSNEEKLVLVHLAQGSLVPPKSEVALRQLFWKGLVVRDPFRIVNESLRKFVLGAARPAEVRRWEKEGGKGWAGMRASFATVLIGSALLLFVGQREILQTWIPYVTGLAGGLAGVLKAFDSLRGGHEQPQG